MSEPAGAWEFASPLQLLADEGAHGDQQAEEVLLLSFTADLGFLESFMLGPAQALGARVTVVSDARMCAPDPRAARSAGIHYLPGLAACARAFHPKLVVLAGRQRATVAIGSGNATLSGWQANRELWTVLRSTETATPAVFTDLAAWLRALPEAASFGHLVPEALTRTAVLLEEHVSRTSSSIASDVRFVSSLETPIIDQLPAHRVDELAVYAPFHDPEAIALRALVKRFGPARLKVAFQPGSTRLDGPAVAALVERVGGELVSDAEARYRHGKLIEWSVGDQRWALTGSPNLSGAALLRTMRTGGNCEIALIAPITRSRMPDGSVAASATVRSLSAPQPRTEPKEQEPLLLSAILATTSSLSLVLAAAVAQPVAVQASARHQDPDEWDELGVVPAGQSDIRFPTNLTAGSRVRLAGSPSRIVFLTDPTAVQRRPLSSAGPAQAAIQFEDFFTDPLLAERFAQELAELRLKIPSRTPGATHASVEASGVRNQAPHVGWQAYLNAAKHVYGDQLVAFALGLPHIQSTTHYEDKSTPGWDESFIQDTAIDEALEAGESRVEDEPDYFLPPDFSKATQRLRRRYQRWAARLVAATAELEDEPVLKLGAVRSLLTLMAARVWESNDDAWSRLLCTALETLGESADADLDLALVGSVAAVALSAMKSYTPDAASSRTVQAVRKLLAHAEEPLIAEYVVPLREFYGSAVDPKTALEYAQYIAARDDIDDVLSTLRNRRFTAHRHGRLIHLVDCRNETSAALEAIGVMGDGQVSGVWASGDDGRWSLMAWRKPHLMEVHCYGLGKAVRRRQFRLTGPATPGSLAAADGLSGRKPYPASPSFFDEMFAALGLSWPDPPTSCDSDTSQSSGEKAPV